MMRSILLGSLAVLAASAACAEPALPPKDLVYCTVCHGADMKGNAIIEAPRLSGMEEWYVKGQLHAFKEGWRGTHEADIAGMEMRPMAAILSDEEIDEAAAWVAATSSPPPARTLRGDAARGETLYGTCAACHGAAAEGRGELGAPPLAGLDDWYLVRQLENFRAGIRGGAAAEVARAADSYDAPRTLDGARGDENLPARQMAAAAATLAGDSDVLDVVAYIITLEAR